MQGLVNKNAIDYRDYTLEELNDTLKWVDRDAYPDRASALEAEIAKRREDPQSRPRTQTSPGPPALRRFLAYVVDYLIFTGVWLVLAETIYFVVEPNLINALGGVLFGLYFVAWEGPGRRHGSPGKRLTRIRIVRSDGAPLSLRDATLRYLVLWVIGGGWIAVVTYPVPLGAGSLILGGVLLGLVSGISLYNIILFFSDPGMRMLQDRITGTEVTRYTPASGREDIPVREDTPAPEQRDLRWGRWIPGRWAFSICVLTVLLAFGGGAFGMVKAMESSFGNEWFRNAFAEYSDMTGQAKRVERLLEETFSIPARVTMVYYPDPEQKEEGQRRIVVTIEVPESDRVEEIKEDIAAAAVGDLEIDPDLYTGGDLGIVTRGFFRKTSESYPLEIYGPEGGEGSGRSDE